MLSHLARFRGPYAQTGQLANHGSVSFRDQYQEVNPKITCDPTSVEIHVIPP